MTLGVNLLADSYVACSIMRPWRTADGHSIGLEKG